MRRQIVNFFSEELNKHANEKAFALNVGDTASVKVRNRFYLFKRVEKQEAGVSPTADLYKDFFEDAPDLNCDALVEECDEDNEEVTRLDIDLLSVEFLVDLLALVETTSKKRNQTSELNGVELEGIIAGFDPIYQTYTFVEEGMIYFVHEGQNNYDIGIDINAGTYLYINNAGVILEVNINGAGDNVIIINQSP